MTDARESEPAHPTQEGIIQPLPERVAADDRRSVAHRLGVAAVAEALSQVVED